ncbi:interferon-induced very large GTPase 1-like [Protopterus annectens]|uniref:interferon-induced very large GTPase 1-like n=1 Tax=Protopterus annectens TaxID=7888 RepID=UPI001CFAD580|nr:interferon-induced very large GTPase 1-like [Protopterus annectens]
MSNHADCEDASLYDRLYCHVCANFIAIPVTLECGHNFCLECVEKFWDTNEDPFCPWCMEKDPDKKCSVNLPLDNADARVLVPGRPSSDVWSGKQEDSSWERTSQGSWTEDSCFARNKGAAQTEELAGADSMEEMFPLMSVEYELPNTDESSAISSLMDKDQNDHSESDEDIYSDPGANIPAQSAGLQDDTNAAQKCEPMREAISEKYTWAGIQDDTNAAQKCEPMREAISEKYTWAGIQDDTNAAQKCEPMREAISEKYTWAGIQDGTNAAEKCESKSEVISEKYMWDNHAQEVLTQVGLVQFCKKKLSLRNVLEISVEALEGCAPKSLEHVPWYFLRKVMRLDASAVNIKCICDHIIRNEMQELESNDIFTTSTCSAVPWIHPLDIIVSVFLCSDALLQQELMVKMASCQFALPLLLPTWNNSCTFLLWALRSVLKKWHPIRGKDNNGFLEEHVVSMKIPTFSFIKVGDINVSKSKILNDILNNKQQYHNIFIHYHMDCANLPKKISNGLAEISWYLPSGSENNDVFTQPFQIINLHGDAFKTPEQAEFLTLISSAVFVFLGDITEMKLQYLKNLTKNKAQIYLILTSDVTIQNAKDLLLSFTQMFNLCKKYIIIKSQQINDSDFTTKLCFRLQSAMDQCSQENMLCLEEMISVAHQCGIHVDEDEEQIQLTKNWCEDIIGLITNADIQDFKCRNFRFQGETCKKLLDFEKEQSRLKNCCGSVVLYTAKLEKQKSQLRQSLLEKDLPDIMKSFIQKLTDLSGSNRVLFLQWIKHKLNSKSQTRMSELKSQYRNKYKTLISTENQTEREQKQTMLQKINNKLSAASLGLEHFMRELGQIYETLITEKKESFQGIPSADTLAYTAAELLLEGLPLELLDGDTGTIAVNWISAVLKEVAILVGRDKCVFVLSVLGVQSTGKSTLLNTMFGLQFAVGSGRGTKGAFIQLLKITGSLQSQLGYDFLMIIDTEGLKAPELQSLVDNYEHDNELATLVTGLSDMTLVNMSMEHSAEMKDILQIVLHAFIRMKIVGKKPVCVFVHQNVGDISAYDQNLIGHKLLLDQLDEIIRAAAKMEKCDDKFTKLADVATFDPNCSKGYIAGLWHGCGPMASISRGYSTSVFELKKSLFQTIQTFSKYKETFSDFSRLIQDTWSAVKMENFIFSFKNSLVAEAFHHITQEFAKWDWEMRRAVQEWTIQAENKIEASETNISSFLETELKMFITETQTVALSHLEKYFTANPEKARLVEEYRQRLINCIQALGQDLLLSASKRCQEANQSKKALKEVNILKLSYSKKLEKGISELLENFKQHKAKLNDYELLFYFDTMWYKETSCIPVPLPKRINIEADMENSLREHMPAMSADINKKIRDVRGDWSLLKGVKDFIPNSLSGHFSNETDEQMAKCKAFLVVEQCSMFVEDIVRQDRDYDPSHWFKVLNYVDKNIIKLQTDRFSYPPEFLLEFKLHVCISALSKFKELHRKFNEENNPLQLLARERENYFYLFKELYKTNDASQTMAETFTEQFLKPAIFKAIEKNLGFDIADDMKNNYSGGGFKARMNFNVAIMYDLYMKDDFETYYNYISSSALFEQTWLHEKIIQHCMRQYNGHTRLFQLATQTLKVLVNMLKNAISNAKVNSETILQFFEKVKENIQSCLVISSNADIFASHTNLECFVKYLEGSINRTEKDIETEIGQWRAATKITSLPYSPTSLLYESLEGCGMCCFWCGTPCENSQLGHVTHSATYHRPVGINGYKNEESNKLIPETCTSIVATIKQFRNKDTKWKWVRIKKYKSVSDHYRSWNIPPDTSLSESSYWKAVFYKYNEKFAEYYKCLPADVPPEWNFSWVDVCRDVADAYNVNLDSF